MGKVNPPFVRSPFNYDVDAVSRETGLLCEDVSLTVQSDAEDADINNIVERFGLTGELPQAVGIPQTGDFTGATTYQESLHLIMAARESFMQFPADVRARFHHDPGELIAFVENPANYEEAVKLGIANARAPASAAPVASTAEPAPQA